MTLIKKNRPRLFPWNDMMLKNFWGTDELFTDDFFEEDSLMPAMNIRETKDNLIVELAAPGFTKKDFEVTLDDDILHVSAKKSKEEIEKDEDRGYSRREFSYNSFRRSLKLPTAIVMDDEVKATYKNGILEITLHKEAEEKALHSKVIEVA